MLRRAVEPVEVPREPETEEVRGAQREIGVAGEVEEDLEAECEDADPDEGGRDRARIAEDGVGSGASVSPMTFFTSPLTSSGSASRR